MTHKQRILKTVRGEPTDRLPFVPRLDLWYRAAKTNGTLPNKYKNASLMDIVQDMDVGYHGIVPDFMDIDSKDDEADRALGIYRLRTMPYLAHFKDDIRTVSVNGDITTVKYNTPEGNLTARILYNDAMRKAGITISHIVEHVIKGPQDFRAVAWLFKNCRVEQHFTGYDAFRDFVGEWGIAAAFTSLAASPMHLIQRELMDMQEFFFGLNDFPQELAWLANEIEDYFNRVFSIASKSSAEIILSGANYDASITYPPFFAKHIKDQLAFQAELLHAHGKYLLTHTDGENSGLLELYLESKIDIADSICPYPMTKLTLQQVRATFGQAITIWGGLPSVCVLEESMNDYEFEAFLDTTLENIGTGDHLILALADTTPPGAKFQRLLKIARACQNFGPIIPGG